MLNRKPDSKMYTVYDFIYCKVQNYVEESMVLEVRLVVSLEFSRKQDVRVCRKFTGECSGDQRL